MFEVSSNPSNPLPYRSLSCSLTTKEFARIVCNLFFPEATLNLSLIKDSNGFWFHLLKPEHPKVYAEKSWMFTCLWVRCLFDIHDRFQLGWSWRIQMLFQPNLQKNWSTHPGNSNMLKLNITHLRRKNTIHLHVNFGGSTHTHGPLRDPKGVSELQSCFIPHWFGNGEDTLSMHA